MISVQLQAALLEKKAAYHHTIWVDPKGKVIPMHSTNHYGWIADNFKKLFPKEKFSTKNVFDVPEKEGWIHVRYHLGGMDNAIHFGGSRAGIKKQYSKLKDILDAAMGESKKFFVDLVVGANRVGMYQLPKDYEQLTVALRRGS